MSTLQKVSNLNVVQLLGTRKAWALPAAYGLTALIQSGLLGVDMASSEQTIAIVLSWVGAVYIMYADAERDKRLDI